MSKVSIVIPVHNAEGTIGDLGRRLVALLGGAHELQLVLVNDGSTDGSDAACRALVDELPGLVTYLRLARNFGEHSAVMAGLGAARGDQVVVMDDDFQNPPEEVPRLLAALSEGVDVVYAQYARHRESLWRTLGSYLNGSMARVVLAKPANLYLASFKAMNRFLVDELVACKTPHPYGDALVLRVTRSIGTVEVRHDPRRRGRSGYGLRKLAALWGNMVVSYSLIPLRVLSVAGFLLTCIGAATLAITVTTDLIPVLKDPTELERLTSVSMFFRGFQLLATGVVGEYVGRIYLKLDQEPQFVVRERLERPGGHARRR